MILLLITTLLVAGDAIDFEEQIEDDYEVPSTLQRHTFEDDPKESFFRQMRSYRFDTNSEDYDDPSPGGNPSRKISPVGEFGELPRPGGFQLFQPYNSQRQVDRDTRSVTYKVLPSPGLKSHFQTDPPNKVFKRSPEYDLQFIQGTASNKDVVSQNYAKSVVEEVTRTAAIAGHLPGYDLKFIQGTVRSDDAPTHPNNQNPNNQNGNNQNPNNQNPNNQNPNNQNNVNNNQNNPNLNNPNQNNPNNPTNPTNPTKDPEVVSKTDVSAGEDLAKPLEITILDSVELPNITQLPLVTSPPVKEDPNNALSINDFIRFRRDVSDGVGRDIGGADSGDIVEDVGGVSEPKIRTKRKEQELKMEARHTDNIPEESMVHERDSPVEVRLQPDGSPVDEDRLRPKRDKIHQERSGKMLLAPSDPILETNREPRGATKEQWIKQPYPIQNTNSKTNHFDNENSPSSSEAVRAPRVHFVTQRRSESAPQPTYHYYDREGRSRDLPRELPSYHRDLHRDLHHDIHSHHELPRGATRDLTRDLTRDSSRDSSRDSLRDSPRDLSRDSSRDSILTRDLPRESSRELDRDRDREYYHRFSRHYNPQQYQPRYNYQNRDTDGHYDRKFEPARDYVPSYNKQRRIIYYATLPEVVRTPPTVDLRDRYNRNRFDDRYSGSSTLSLAAADPYRFRKAYPPTKSRYEEVDRPKGPYPLKVSADVNVREIKKNPERRIYSDADRRYALQAPSYQPEGDLYERRL